MFNIFSLFKTVKIRTHMQGCTSKTGYSVSHWFIFLFLSSSYRSKTPKSLAWMHSRRMYCERKLSILELQTPQCFHWKRNIKNQTDSNTSIPVNVFWYILTNPLLFHRTQKSEATHSCCDNQFYCMAMTSTSFQSALIKCIFWYSVPHTFQVVEKGSKHFPIYHCHVT